MTTPTNQAVLSIAGSDPSGGAGIQADLKTFSAVGVYGAAAITCLTAQNSAGVEAVQPVAPGFVKKQVKLVLADLPITHIKTGMIGTAGVATALGDIFYDFSGELICDPVLRASDGRPLMEEHGLEEFLENIVANATVITPNRQELEVLSGVPVPNRGAIEAATARLFERFGGLKALVVTGGHIDKDTDTVTDSFYQLGCAVIEKSHSRLPARNTHGTGCTFASAFAAYHLILDDYRQAFEQAVDFMDDLLRLSADHRIGIGAGPLLHHLATPSRPQN